MSILRQQRLIRKKNEKTSQSFWSQITISKSQQLSAGSNCRRSAELMLDFRCGLLILGEIHPLPYSPILAAELIRCRPSLDASISLLITYGSWGGERPREPGVFALSFVSKRPRRREGGFKSVAQNLKKKLFGFRGDHEERHTQLSAYFSISSARARYRSSTCSVLQGFSEGFRNQGTF